MSAGAASLLWLADSTFLVGIASAGIVDAALRVLGGRLSITPVVRDEVTRHAAARPELSAVLAAVQAGGITVVSLTVEELRTAVSLHSGVWQRSPRDTKDLGEAETIAVAVCRGWNAVIDDRQARIAMELRAPAVACATTPRVVLALSDLGAFSEDDAWSAIETMTRKGFERHEMAGKRKADWLALRRFPLRL